MQRYFSEFTVNNDGNKVNTAADELKLIAALKKFSYY